MAQQTLSGFSMIVGNAIWGEMTPSDAPLTTATGRLDALNEQVGYIGRVWWPSRTGTKNISDIHWYNGSAVNGTYTVTVGLQDISATNVPDGTFDQSTTHSDTLAAGAVTSTLGATRTVSYGDYVCVVFKMTAYSTGRVQPTGLGLGALNARTYGYTFSKWDSAGDWSTITNTGLLPNFVFEFDDATYGTFDGCTPNFTAINTETYNNATAGTGLGTGDERALRFTVSQDTVFDGGILYVSTAGTTSDFDVVLYNGTTALATETFTGDSSLATGGMRVQFNCAPQTLSSGNTYYLSVKPTTANNLSIVSLTYSDAAFAKMMYGGLATAEYDCRADAGAWQAPAGSDARAPWFFPKISAMSDGAGGGGGITINTQGVIGG